MQIITLLADAAGQAAPQNKFGFVEALEQGGFIAYATVAILGVMSFGSFYILFTKWVEQSKVMKGANTLDGLWRANSLREGANKLDKNSAWRQLVDDGLEAEEQATKLVDEGERHDWLHNSLARSEASINAKLASGLPFLATVGATSPFIGLFGTVWGIMNAFMNIGQQGSTDLAVVSTPIAEALIATALGLAAAIPAVYFYNHFTSKVKTYASEMDDFALEFLNISERNFT